MGPMSEGRRTQASTLMGAARIAMWAGTSVRHRTSLEARVTDGGVLTEVLGGPGVDDDTDLPLFLHLILI